MARLFLFMDLTTNKIVETREEREKRKAERYKQDIKEMLKTAGGRRLYWEWMSRGGIYREQFVQGLNDQTNYNLGRMAFSRELLNDLLDAEPQKYMQMQQEYAAEKASEEALDKILEKQEKS